MFKLKNNNYTLLFLALALLSKAQDDYAGPKARDYSKKPAKTAGFIELGGNAGLFSLNIDRIYYYKENLKVSARLGGAPHMNNIYIEQIYVVENNFILLKNL